MFHCLFFPRSEFLEELSDSIKAANQMTLFSAAFSLKCRVRLLQDCIGDDRVQFVFPREVIWQQTSCIGHNYQVLC